MPEPSFWVEPDALASVAGGTLLYPAAGRDMAPMLKAFAPPIRTFIFNDLYTGYGLGSQHTLPDGLRSISARDSVENMSDEPVQTRTDGAGRSYRYLEPSFQRATYDLLGGSIEIVRRRGFGQYALLEQPAESISVFVHRSDSPGESGSNMWFLGNVQRRHEPLSNLWDKLAVRLRSQALVVSDGSLTRFNWLQVKENSAEEAYRRRSASEPRLYKGSRWRCVGFMADRGKTLVWHVTKFVEGEGAR